jgi:hypothetical protein
MFGVAYFVHVEKNYSWPVAACLSLACGLVMLLLFQRVGRGSVSTPNKAESDGQNERA